MSMQYAMVNSLYITTYEGHVDHVLKSLFWKRWSRCYEKPTWRIYDVEKFAELHFYGSFKLDVMFKKKFGTRKSSKKPSFFILIRSLECPVSPWMDEWLFTWHKSCKFFKARREIPSQEKAFMGLYDTKEFTKCVTT